MLPTFAKTSVVRIRPGTKLERGSTIYDWTSATQETINDCSVQPANTTLSQDGRVGGISDGMTLYAPFTADIQAGDRIQYNGNTYTINGDVRRWESPTGALKHIQADLVRYEG